LEGFLIEMSARLYRMEGKLPPPRLSSELLDELNQAAPKEPGFLESIPESVKTIVATSALGVLVIGLGALLFWWNEEKKTYEFPEAEGSPILEAPQAAGVGGVLSYASASNPPSHQKNQVPDYLQRL